MKKYVSYFRVSTQKQGMTGLGIEAQRNAVSNYVGSNGEIIGDFTEVETGTRKKKRVEIYKAIELAKKEKAILVVAKLDRLSRDVEFTSALFNAQIEFVCCDNPNANKLTIQLLSVISEHEAEVISQRVRDALRVKKEKIKRGDYVNKDGSIMKSVNGVFRLGNPNGFGEYQERGLEKIKENAQNHISNVQAMDIICSVRNEDLSYQNIAIKLNNLQYTTRYGKKFSAMQVMRLYKRGIEKRNIN